MAAAACRHMAAAAAATVVLPPCAAPVAMKTPVATAMAGAHTTINNQLKAVTAMVTEMTRMTATTMAMETKAMMAARAAARGRWPAWWRRQQLGESAALAAVAALWLRRRRQCGGSSGHLGGGGISFAEA